MQNFVRTNGWRKSAIKRVLGLGLAACLVAAPAVAGAQTVGCKAYVKGYSITTDGLLKGVFQANGETSTRVWFLCYLNGQTSVNLGSQAKNITVQTCQAYLALLTSSQATSTPVTLWFESAYLQSCAALPASYAFPQPFPAEMVLTGWQ